ncbi:unnamed protein product [Rhizoctonia solani]|uniref:Uncharacterized protein n=1 Tax=Rhizoctonia solani TaxID=456999 RepID=A0A8H2X582_9AGAM|nr:unnamed protein product [Rhizoctonia solani]
MFDMQMPNISVLLMATPHLRTRLSKLWAALRGDVSFTADRLVSFVANLVEDGGGDISWEDARWKGLISHPKPGAEADRENERGYEVDMHTLALEKSQGGNKLIRYHNLPERWRNNEFVWEGYRFIPGARWPALVFSMFQPHNETVNIQTHFVPLLAILSVILPWELMVTRHPFFSSLPSFSPVGISAFGFTPLPSSPADPMPKFFYLLAAGACLTCSTIWHTLAGCSDLWLLEAGARIDYVGIGWLISASVSGVVYYGFACQPAIMRFYISIAIMTGIAGSILPFQAWFDERKNKVPSPRLSYAI